MSEPTLATAIRVSEIRLPDLVSTAVRGIPDVAAALGELRCLVEPVLAGIAARKAANDYSGADLALEAYIAVVARLAADHPDAVAGAVAPVSCACAAVCTRADHVHDYSRGGVKLALVESIRDMPAAPRPGIGAYL